MSSADGSRNVIRDASWLTVLISTLRRPASVSRSAAPNPVMLRIIAPPQRGKGTSIAGSGQRGAVSDATAPARSGCGGEAGVSIPEAPLDPVQEPVPGEGPSRQVVQTGAGGHVLPTEKGVDVHDPDVEAEVEGGLGGDGGDPRRLEDVHPTAVPRLEPGDDLEVPAREREVVVDEPGAPALRGRVEPGARAAPAGVPTFERERLPEERDPPGHLPPHEVARGHRAHPDRRRATGVVLLARAVTGVGRIRRGRPLESETESRDGIRRQADARDAEADPADLELAADAERGPVEEDGLHLVIRQERRAPRSGRELGHGTR